jgi:hypothetical protein
MLKYSLNFEEKKKQKQKQNKKKKACLSECEVVR